MSDLSPLLRELDELLTALPPEDEAAMDLCELEGYLAGLAILPKPVPPEDWLPLIWEGNPEDFAADAVKHARLIELVQQRKAMVIGAFLKGDLTYDPTFQFDLDDTPIWEIWVEGFVHAIAFQPEAVQAWMTTNDEDLGAAAFGMMDLIALMNDRKRSKKLDAEFYEMVGSLITHYAETIYRCQRGLPRIALA